MVICPDDASIKRYAIPSGQKHKIVNPCHVCLSVYLIICLSFYFNYHPSLPVISLHPQRYSWKCQLVPRTHVQRHCGDNYGSTPTGRVSTSAMAPHGSHCWRVRAVAAQCNPHAQVSYQWLQNLDFHFSVSPLLRAQASGLCGGTSGSHHQLRNVRHRGMRDDTQPKQTPIYNL